MTHNAISTTTLEDDLLLPSWGAWAREGEGPSLPAWVVIMLQRQAYREIYASPPPISDEYAMKLDGLIAGLPDIVRNTVYSLYVCQVSLRRLATVQRRSTAKVSQDRDFALAYLYGALRNTEQVA